MRVSALYSNGDEIDRMPYRSIFRSQPEVRVVIEFLARNIAQLGLHLFERLTDEDRRRDTNHEVIRALNRPTPWMTRYRLIEQTVVDMAVHAHAYWVIVAGPNDDQDLQWLVPVPPERMRVEGDLAPKRFLYCPYGRESTKDALELRREQVVHFVYSDGTSPLETLRPLLSEARASASYRAQLWKTHARIGGVVQRPLEAPKWTLEARTRWREQFDAKHAGPGNAGRVLVLEEGMTWQPTTQTSRDSQWEAGYKLTREDVARAYHMPLPMVGILDHATFSNIKEQHRHLYQDCIGPWLEDMTQTLELQLLAQFQGAESRYLEFNIQQKLAGSFEEQVSSLQTSVGGPWVSRNEARARMNLPRVDDEAFDQPLSPLNMATDASAVSDPREAPAL